MSFTSVNPATGETLEEFSALEDVQIQDAIHRGARTFRSWRYTSMEERDALMRRAAVLLRENADAYARVITTEMGKPITQSRAEVEKCAWGCEYYAENAASILAREHLPSDGSESYVRFDPLGVILAVMPWNFPFWQVFRFAAPALMAGNTALLKHASNVPRCALLIEEIFREAGFPEGCFQTLLIPSSAVSTVIDHPDVVAATLTGSENAGSKVAERAGMRLKKTVLELGGSDPFIVLDDADVDAAASIGATARMLNTGQSCIAAKRFILHEAIAERFIERFLDTLRDMKVGDPMDQDTEVGPMAREDLLRDLDSQVRRSVDMGAELLLGGTRMEGAGSFYPATVVTGVRAGMPMYEEETFGPAAAIIRVRDEEEALHIANDTTFGLGASLWTENRARAERCTARIDAGNVFVNGLVKSDPRLPFGGIGRSGYGRELSHYGIKEFVNKKTIWVK